MVCVRVFQALLLALHRLDGFLASSFAMPPKVSAMISEYSYLYAVCMAYMCQRLYASLSVCVRTVNESLNFYTHFQLTSAEL